MGLERFLTQRNLSDHLAAQSLETLKDNARQLWVAARETGREMTRHKRTLANWNPFTQAQVSARACETLVHLLSLHDRIDHFAALTGQALLRKAQEEGPLTGRAQYNLMRHTRMTRKIMGGISRPAEKALSQYRCATRHAEPDSAFVRLGHGVIILAGGKIILDFFAPDAVPLETQRVAIPIAGALLAGVVFKPELCAARDWVRTRYRMQVKKETPFPLALERFLNGYNAQGRAVCPPRAKRARIAAPA